MKISFLLLAIIICTSSANAQTIGDTVYKEIEKYALGGKNVFRINKFNFQKAQVIGYKSEYSLVIIPHKKQSRNNLNFIITEYDKSNIKNVVKFTLEFNAMNNLFSGVKTSDLFGNFESHIKIIDNQLSSLTFLQSDGKKKIVTSITDSLKLTRLLPIIAEVSINENGHSKKSVLILVPVIVGQNPTNNNHWIFKENSSVRVGRYVNSCIFFNKCPFSREASKEIIEIEFEKFEQ